MDQSQYLRINYDLYRVLIVSSQLYSILRFFYERSNVSLIFKIIIKIENILIYIIATLLNHEILHQISPGDE